MSQRRSRPGKPTKTTRSPKTRTPSSSRRKKVEDAEGREKVKRRGNVYPSATHPDIDYFLPDTTLNNKQQKYCRCVLHVASGKQAYNPYAVCAKTVGTTTPCAQDLEWTNVPKEEIVGYLRLKGIPVPRDRSRKALLMRLSQNICKDPRVSQKQRRLCGGEELSEGTSESDEEPYEREIPSYPARGRTRAPPRQKGSRYAERDEGSATEDGEEEEEEEEEEPLRSDRGRSSSRGRNRRNEPKDADYNPRRTGGRRASPSGGRNGGGRAGRSPERRRASPGRRTTRKL